MFLHQGHRTKLKVTGGLSLIERHSKSCHCCQLVIMFCSHGVIAVKFSNIPCYVSVIVLYQCSDISVFMLQIAVGAWWSSD